MHMLMCAYACIQIIFQTEGSVSHIVVDSNNVLHAHKRNYVTVCLCRKRI